MTQLIVAAATSSYTHYLGNKGADYFDCGEGIDIVLEFNPAEGDIIKRDKLDKIIWKTCGIMCVTPRIQPINFKR